MKPSKKSKIAQEFTGEAERFHEDNILMKRYQAESSTFRRVIFGILAIVVLLSSMAMHVKLFFFSVDSGNVSLVFFPILVLQYLFLYTLARIFNLDWYSIKKHIQNKI